jgi:hypothetical protein
MLAIASLVAVSMGHGGLVIPPARNNFGNRDPMNFAKNKNYSIPGGSCVGDEVSRVSVCSILSGTDLLSLSILQ